MTISGKANICLSRVSGLISSLFLSGLLSLTGALSFSTNASAATVGLKWDAVPGATSYSIYQSVDVGATWTKVLDTQSYPVTISNVPDTGLVLFRISAKNATQEQIRLEAGGWYNGSWSLAPRGLAVQ